MASCPHHALLPSGRAKLYGLEAGTHGDGGTMQGHQRLERGYNGDEAPPRTDISEHQRTFDALLTLTKWGIAVVVLVLIGLAVFLL